MSNQDSKLQKSHLIIGIMAILAIWLLLLMAAISWFQQGYIKNFTQDQGEFLNADFSNDWLQSLTQLLPPKSSRHRIIQLWQPDCLCNRFARTHAIQALHLAKQMQIEHITVIPSSAIDAQAELQALNPDTRVISLDPAVLTQWPASPSIFLEHASLGLIYFGPLGFGAFCSQASTSLIEQQMRSLDKSTAKPFYNVIGKGCFCPWK